MTTPNLTDEQIAALTALLLPSRERLERAWTGRKPIARTSRAASATPDLLDLDTVATRLSCSRTHVYNLVAAGELVRRDVGVPGSGRAKTRVTAKSVDEYIARGLKRG